MLRDQILDPLIAHLPCAEALHVERDRPRPADDIRDLDLEAVGEARGHDVLRDVARRIRGGAVDLRRILAAERPAAVPCVAAVCVDDDLAPGETGVAHRTADRERARAVHDVDGVLVEPGFRDRGLDHDLLDVGLDAVVRHAGIVLRGDDDGVHALRHAARILDRDLRLAVGPQVRDGPPAPRLRELARERVRERDRKRHELGRLFHREAEHHSLVAGAELVRIGPGTGLERFVDAHRDLA